MFSGQLFRSDRISRRVSNDQWSNRFKVCVFWDRSKIVQLDLCRFRFLGQFGDFGNLDSLSQPVCRIWKPLWSCLEGSYSDSEVPKFEKTHRQSSPLSWYLCYCTYLVATASLLAPPPRINEKCPCKSSAARLATSYRIQTVFYHFTLLICFHEFSSFPSFCW